MNLESGYAVNQKNTIMGKIIKFIKQRATDIMKT